MYPVEINKIEPTNTNLNYENNLVKQNNEVIMRDSFSQPVMQSQQPFDNGYHNVISNLQQQPITNGGYMNMGRLKPTPKDYNYVTISKTPTYQADNYVQSNNNYNESQMDNSVKSHYYVFLPLLHNYYLRSHYSVV